MTSSQAHNAFVVAFPEYQEDPAWIATAKYLYGNSNWRLELLHVTDAAAELQLEDNGGAHSPTRPITLHAYVQQIIPAEDDPLARRALDFLKLYVGAVDNLLNPTEDEDSTDNDENPAVSGVVENNTGSVHSSSVTGSREEEGEEGTGGEKIIRTLQEAKALVDGLNSSLRKVILQLLSEHVHAPFRKAATKQDLIGWLQEPNSTRSYWFYKSGGLKALISARGISLGTGRKTMDQMRDALAGRNIVIGTATRTISGGSVLTPNDAAAKAILEKSFLPHQKGQKREHCSLGHRLEIPILKSWIQEAAAPVHGLVVKGAYSAGLAAKQDATYAKDSVDFVLTVLEDNEDLKTWGFEAKGRVTARTAAEEERNLHYLNQPHVRIADEYVHEEVAHLSERFQVLQQHAFVYNFYSVVLAISDNQSMLIRSTIIDFTRELKNQFGSVLKKLKDISLDWANPPAILQEDEARH